MEDMAILKKIALALALVILYLPIENFKKLYKAIIFSSIAAILFSLVKLFLLLVFRWVLIDYYMSLIR